MALERQRDWLFESICSVCGIAPGAKIPAGERGKINAATKQLREIGAKPEDVLARAEAYRREWPKVSLTPTALAAHWSYLESKVRKTAARKSMKDLAEQCELEGHTYSDDATVVCGRCSRIVQARAREVCERYGHLRTVKGVCQRCSDGATR